MLGFVRITALAAEASEANGAQSHPPVAIHALTRDGQILATGWALPFHGAYVAPRSLVAQAAHVELMLEGESGVPVRSVLGEDVEANLVLLATDPVGEDPDSSTANPHITKPPEQSESSASEVAPQQAQLTVSCGETTHRIDSWRARDIPVFGLAYTGELRFQEPVAGCPVLDSNGALQAVTVWENRFGSPSAAFVPAARLAQLERGSSATWEEWRESRQRPDRQLRDNLLSEALFDILCERYTFAQENLTFLLEKNPSDARGWYYRGYARAMSGQRRLAIIDYENAVYFEPDNAEARFSLGFNYALSHRADDARTQAVALRTLNATLAERLEALLDAVDDSRHEAEDLPEQPEPVPPPETAPAPN
ncbi:MAG: tetratricopeptide repeat protein [Bryobacterales bacterium]|nr:tetratricopeptide repeat protein [Bryobacterales bacterium]